jgi:hypothetical protein
MRLVIATVVFACIGLGIGLGLTAIEFDIEERFHGSPRTGSSTPVVQQQHEQAPKVVVVGGQDYDFGQASHNEARDHVFEVRNEGSADLRLKFHNVSCGRCVTFSDDFSVEVAPQETAKVPVRFSTKKLNEDFNEYVELSTNDPALPILRLSIIGKVTRAIHLSHDELFLSNIASGQRVRTAFDIYAYESDTIEMLGYDCSDALTAGNFELEFTPLDLAEVDRIPQPTAAARVTVRVNPGLPVGALSQTLHIELRAGVQTVIEVPITGMVVSDVSVVGGRNFDREKNTLVLRKVSAATGTSDSLRLLVKGPHRENVSVSIGSIDPEGILIARVGEVQKLGNNGSVYMFPLEIEIAQGRPPVNRLGNTQGPAGEIVLNTTHPDAQRVRIQVSFATE